MGRKIPGLFAKKHHGNESEFYADLLSHLLKNKLKLGQRQVINIAERGKTTRNHVLEMAMTKARERFAKKQDAAEISSEVVFNVQNPAPSRCSACRIIWREPCSACSSGAKPATTISCGNGFRWWWIFTIRINTPAARIITTPDGR